jgi:hypothetical protein
VLLRGPTKSRIWQDRRLLASSISPFQNVIKGFVLGYLTRCCRNTPIVNIWQSRQLKTALRREAAALALQ